jgi:hypothetical protein
MQEIAFRHERDLDLAHIWRMVRTHEDAVDARYASYNHTNEYVEIIAFHPMDRSDRVETTEAWIRERADAFMARNPELEIALHGELLYYPRTARIPSAQLPQVVWTNLLTTFLFYAIVMRRFAKNGFAISSIKTGWVLTQPFLFTSGMIGLRMAFFGTPLDMATAPILPVVVAAAADFNVYIAMLFFLLLAKSELSVEHMMDNVLQEQGRAVVADWQGNSLCLSLLVTSAFIPIYYLGMLALEGLFWCVAWSLFATPALLMGCVRKEVRHEEHTYDLFVFSRRSFALLQNCARGR